ncbi:RDD family protein [Halobacillus sp. A1]|uniref:RDD family protein n=1 Tax=Halobacillus sp. A1 TaxID=2880262 RepID=UPI0020A6291E|nr:RDD family protein [Halobacillus sp. A1]MCP3033077.1 RDD family protein [Halobacillus sp. A1]
MEYKPSRAGFKRRAAAYFLDFFIISIPAAIILFFVSDGFSFEFTQGVWWNLIYTVYLTILPVLWGGYIIGKRIIKVRVVKLNHKRLSVFDMFVREFIGKFVLGYVSLGLTALISACMVAFLKDRRAIHDFLAGTYVERGH